MQTTPDNLPAALDVERVVLGAAFTNQDSVVQILDSLTSSDFSIEKHRRIFAAIKELVARRFAIDRMIVVNYLASRNELESVDGISYLVSLDDDLPVIQNLKGYFAILKEKAALRRLWTLAEGIRSGIQGCGESKDIIEATTNEIYRINRASGDDTSIVSLGEYMDTYPGGMQALFEPGAANQGRHFGFSRLDDLTDGLHEAEMMLVGAPPGTGKTAFALQVARNYANRGDAVAIFSMEMPRRALLNRMICALSEISTNRFRKGEFSAQERLQILEAAELVRGWPIFVDATPHLTVPKLALKLEQLRKRHAIKLVEIDFLQMMKTDNPRHSLSDRLMEVCSGLVQVRKESGVPMLAMSQVDRSIPKLKRKPTIADSFGSAGIEQYADMLMFIWRDDTQTEFLLRKNREGETAEIPMRFIGWRQEFLEPT